MLALFKNIFVAFIVVIGFTLALSTLIGYWGGIAYLAYVGVSMLIASGFQQPSDVLLGLVLIIIIGRLLRKAAQKYSSNSTK